MAPMTGFPSIVETYLGDLRRIRASGGATGERSGYGPLANLINEIGGGLKSKVFCIGELVDQGACRPAVRSDRDQASRCVGRRDCRWWTGRSWGCRIVRRGCEVVAKARGTGTGAGVGGGGPRGLPAAGSG